MYLRFETKVSETEKDGLPILVDVESITPDSSAASGVMIDGAEVGLDDNLIAKFQAVVAHINAESLPPKHFRDCAHFAMAMCGLWMSTHPMFDRSHTMVTSCNDQPEDKEHLGPTALGVPNDERCLGFGSIPFVYSHVVFGVQSSLGILCFSKLGVDAEYSLSTFNAALADSVLEVSHPINSLSIVSGGQDVFKWQREAQS